MQKAIEEGLQLTRYWHPRYWPTWCVVAIIRLFALLPLRALQWMGAMTGALVYLFSSRRRKITQRNIALCFPDYNPKQQRQIVWRSFISNGIGLLEGAYGWFRNPETLRSRISVHGYEHIEAAQSKGKGVILLGGHYSSLEIAGAFISLFIDGSIMQRRHNNQLINAIMTRARHKYYAHILDKKDIRGMLRVLKNNGIIWYAVDQDYGKTNSVFAPFFGQQAATLSSTARIAHKTGATVIPFSHFRRDKGKGFDIYFHPPIPDFPSQNDMADAGALNNVLENEIRKYPSQYLWMHRRFKTQPEGAPSPYQGI